MCWCGVFYALGDAWTPFRFDGRNGFADVIFELGFLVAAPTPWGLQP